MNTADGTWTLGVKIGLPFAILGAFAFLVLIGFAVLYAREKDKAGFPLIETTAARWAWVAGFVALFMLYVGGMIFAYWPLSAEYHQYRPVSGTVSTIASRFVGSNHSTDQKFVVTFTTGPQQYAITDTRAALLKPGDRVSLQCIRVWDYGSTDAGYDCKWGQS